MPDGLEKHGGNTGGEVAKQRNSETTTTTAVTTTTTTTTTSTTTSTATTSDPPTTASRSSRGRDTDDTKDVETTKSSPRHQSKQSYDQTSHRPKRTQAGGEGTEEQSHEKELAGNRKRPTILLRMAGHGNQRVSATHAKQVTSDQPVDTDITDEPNSLWADQPPTENDVTKGGGEIESTESQAQSESPVTQKSITGSSNITLGDDTEQVALEETNTSHVVETRSRRGVQKHPPPRKLQPRLQAKRRRLGASSSDHSHDRDGQGDEEEEEGEVVDGKKKTEEESQSSHQGQSKNTDTKTSPRKEPDTEGGGDSDEDANDEETQHLKHDHQNHTQRMQSVQQEFLDLKERLYEARMADLDQEEDQLAHGTHPAIQSRLAEVTSRRDERMLLVRRRRDYAIQAARNSFEANTALARNHFLCSSLELRGQLAERVEEKLDSLLLERELIDQIEGTTRHEHLTGYRLWHNQLTDKLAG